MLRGSVRRITNKDLASQNSDVSIRNYDIASAVEDLSETIARTGRLPSGTYVFQARVTMPGGLLLDEHEVRVDLVNPTRLELLTPGGPFGDQPEVVNASAPRFQWSTDEALVGGSQQYKYQGDCIMAEFGVPMPLEDHAVQACRSALAMLEELERLRGKWAAEGKPELQARVGINTGLVLVGNLGSSRIMGYTVVGDHVNLASRLEGANKQYGTKIMVSEFTFDAVKEEMVGRELDRILVKGKVHPVRVYEILCRRDQGIPPGTADLVDDFERALGLYKTHWYDEALFAFERVAERHPDDGPTELYLERCRKHLEKSPPRDWDGVHTLKIK